MKQGSTEFLFPLPHFTAGLLCLALLPVRTTVLAQQPQAQSAVQQTATTTEEAAPKIPNDQLDSLVAPIALYPDPLLAQTLAASTYPLEIVQLQQWLTKNPTLKDKALADAVAKQNWDPSIQAMASLPEVMKQLASNISWTSDLGNAFLTQQSDVMEAVQRMRMKAQGAGALKTSQQQKVETRQVEGKDVVVIEQADPKVIYVPSYNPTVVYGAPVYPYPSIYYPPPVVGAAIAFGVGVAIGYAWHGGWGWGCGWGHNDINVNVNNNFVNNFNRKNVNNRIGNNNINNRVGNNNVWQHNPQHRGGAPYPNRATANKFGGNTRGGPINNRPAGGTIAGGGNRPGAGGVRPGAGGSGERIAGEGNRPGGGGVRPGGGGSGERRPDAGSNRLGGGGSGERIGNRQVSRTPSARSNSAFSGGGFNRSAAMASHNRGSMSMGRGGGGFRGGGRRR